MDVIYCCALLHASRPSPTAPLFLWLPAVKGWNVKVFALGRQGRNRDIAVVQDYFKHLDAFLLSHKHKSMLAY
jgi:hypothetical protein